MVWTIKRIEAEYFMGFRHLDLDLSKFRGITSVEGLRSSPGTSNGASKSTIFEAIHWCLRGKTIRRLKKADKVMHRWMPDDGRTVVRLTIDVDGREFVPERIRGKSGVALRAHMAGESQGASTIEGVQGVIDRVLGFHDDRTLTSTAIFSGSMAQFCQLTDAERKAALERMIGADHFAAAAQLASDRAAALMAEAGQHETAAGEARKRFDMILAEKQRVVTGVINRAITQQQQEDDLFAQVEIDISRTRAAYDKLTEYYVGAVEAARVARLERGRQEKLRDAAVSRIEEVRGLVVELDKQMAVAHANIAQERKNRAAQASGTHPDKCPTCGQRWPHEEDPEHLATALAEADAKIRKLSAAIAPLEAAKSAHNQEIAEEERKRRRAIAEIEALNEATSDRQERALMAAACGAEGVMYASMEALARHRASMQDPEHGELNTECPEIDARLDKVRAEITRLDNAAADARAKADQMAFWKKGFGRRGMPSYLLDSSIPGMNDVVARIASMLSNGELSVSFDPQAAKGSGEVFAVNVEYANGGDDYDSTSNGEHTRVDLAVMFALRDLVERRGGNRCSQLFLDEVFNGTDAAFAEACMSMLRAHYADRDIFLISHDDAVKSLCDNTITVVKEGREAVVRG